MGRLGANTEIPVNNGTPSMNSSEARAGTRTYVGVFGVTLVTLMYEILLTRIFSVTMWYHFAFMAISIAMFGMTVGGIVVYLDPAYSRQDQAVPQMGRSSFLFALWIVIGILTHLFVPFYTGTSLKGLASMVVTFASLSAAFVYSGICVCLALTKFPRQVSRIYAVDLAGAASGCVFLIGVFKVTDGLSAVFVAALLAALASILFSSQGRHERFHRTALLFSTLLAALLIANTITARRGSPLLDLIWVKGKPEATPLYEKWNSFSRLTVFGDPDSPMSPITEGTSPTYPTNTRSLRTPFDDRCLRGNHLNLVCRRFHRRGPLEIRCQRDRLLRSPEFEGSHHRSRWRQGYSRGAGLGSKIRSSGGDESGHPGHVEWKVR